MKSHLPAFSIAFALICGAGAVEPAPQPQLTFVPAGGDDWEIDWPGVSGRTYFIQWSLDLLDWDYAPVVDHGTTPVPVGTDSEGEVNYFVRLKYVDYNWVDDRASAEAADFDSDSIPNLFEVATVGSDPFDMHSAGPDTDGDGLPDGWEEYHFGGLGFADPNAKLFSDGLTNKEKSQLGLGPLADDLSLTTERITYTYDGERLDGVNFYTQREFGYGLDGNGNIETTTSD